MISNVFIVLSSEEEARKSVIFQNTLIKRTEGNVLYPPDMFRYLKNLMVLSLDVIFYDVDFPFIVEIRRKSCELTI